MGHHPKKQYMISEGKEKGTESIFKWLTLMGEGGQRVQNSSYKMSQFWGT